MTGPRSTTDLAQTCWCDTHVRYVPPAVVWAGEGWACCPECQPGCAPGVGQKQRGRPRRAATVAPCGTPAGYVRHRRAGEQPCADCTTANAAYKRARYAARRAAA